MEIRLRVHLQEQTSGRFAARVPDMPWILHRAADRDAAVAGARGQAMAFLHGGHSGDWSEHPFHENAWLVALPMEVEPRSSSGGAAVPVTVSLLVTRLGDGDEARFRVQVPAARGVEV